MQKPKLQSPRACPAARMKTVGIFVDGIVNSGGGFQYELSVINIINRFNADKYNFIYFVDSASKKQSLAAHCSNVVQYRSGFVRNLAAALSSNLFIYRYGLRLGVKETYLDKLLNAHQVDIVYFLSPTSRCRQLVSHNYMMTVWDLGHRDWPEFPEASQFREFESREEIYDLYLKRAIAVIVESDLGKRNIKKRYGVCESRISILRMPVPPSIYGQRGEFSIKEKYRIPGDYVFYPAQFWPHKNHVYLLDGLRILKEEHDVIVHAILTGNNKGNRDYVQRKAQEYGIADQVLFPGFVPYEEVPLLYEQALALVMPTYFGPTNIPPMEAFSLGCPVCYSDLPGLRDQVGTLPFCLILATRTAWRNRS